MAKALISEGSLESDDDRLSELLRTAKPLRIDPFRKRRILVRLERQAGPARRAGQERRSSPRFWLRPTLAAALFVSGSAAAELGHRYVARDAGLYASVTGFGSNAVPAPPRVRVPVPVRDCVARAPASAEQASPVAPAAGHRVNAVSAPAEPEAREDPEPVALAIQALRSEGNPLRAQGLLDAYLSAHPHGALVGEALALAIEAASARRDPRAADYARRYLAHFPHGQYRDLAQRASTTAPVRSE